MKEPEFIDNTERIRQAVRDIDEEMQQKPAPPSIEITEVRKAQMSLKRGKSAGEHTKRGTP